jgi:hypothetical protein
VVGVVGSRRTRHETDHGQRAYAEQGNHRHDYGMTKSGGRCIEILIEGVPTKLCTIGHVADALNRTGWTVKYWEAIGLLPPARFILNPEVPRTRRRLYSEEYVHALGLIADQGYLGQRLDRNHWDRFHHEVLAAYKETVTPLISAGVTEPTPSSTSTYRSGQGNPRQT